ncbi:hypothetical protein BS47DRAFT_406118 [Hydnum rufescens UP504]|uniref:Dystroglycan-type cadherin-like domain-containing protein n=1 Tax=Hydnum rufescens UP504 TaxID=1448309 RepID=A0A9P6E292_9AGAM|nr:hypothetical protein BS47DRAFT_406118 [Hydnum rufescens UP504]
MHHYHILSLIISLTAAALAFASDAPSPTNVTLNYPLLQQLYPTNHAITPFIVANYSVLPQGLRLPPSWSFSIGLEWDTFIMNDGRDIYYSGMLADGSKLPPWITFVKDEITFEGVSPPIHDFQTLELMLLASDADGKRLGNQNFNLTIAEHELSSITASLLPLNLTVNTSFSFNLDEVVFPFLRLDGKELNHTERLSLNVSLDPEAAAWMTYSDGMLKGVGPQTPPASIIIQIQDTFNRGSHGGHLDISVPISMVSSYFTTATIPPVLIESGDEFSMSFLPYLSNNTEEGTTRLTATYEPRNSSSWLSFEESPPKLHGTVPDSARSTHVNVTITAMGSTGAISSSSLYLSIDAVAAARPDNSSSLGPKSLSTHGKLAIGIVLGIFGGFITLCCILAIVRRSNNERKAEEGIRAGPRSGPKEYVIDQLEDAYGGYREEKSEVNTTDADPSARSAVFIPDPDRDDLESQSTSFPVHVSEEVTVPAPPHVRYDEGPTSPTMPKRDFFKLVRHYPSRNLRAQPDVSTARKISASSIRSTIQNTFNSLTRSRVSMPPISKPFPFTMKRRPLHKPANKETDDNESFTDAGSDHTQSQHHQTEEWSGSPPRLAPLFPAHSLPAAASSGTDSSLEGGVSIEGQSNERGEGGIIDAASHIWVHRKAGSARRTSGSLRSNDIRDRSRDPATDTAGASVNSQGTPGRSFDDRTRAQTPGLFPQSVSSDLGSTEEMRIDVSEEAIVQKARSVNFNDRTSKSTPRRYSSASSAIEDQILNRAPQE